MKFPDMPGLPDRTSRERFIDLVRHVISVPKEELNKREADYQKKRTVRKQRRDSRRN